MSINNKFNNFHFNNKSGLLNSLEISKNCQDYPKVVGET